MVKPKKAKRANRDVGKLQIRDENVRFVGAVYPYLLPATRLSLYAGLGFPFIFVDVLVDIAIAEERRLALDGLREEEEPEAPEEDEVEEVREFDFGEVWEAYRGGWAPKDIEWMDALEEEEDEFQKTNEEPLDLGLIKAKPKRYAWVWTVFGNPRDNVGDLLHCLDGLIEIIPELTDQRIKDTIIEILRGMKRLTSPSMEVPKGAVGAAYMVAAGNSLLVYDIFGIVHWLEKPNDVETTAWISKLWREGLDANVMPSGLIPIADIEIEGITDELKDEIIAAGYLTIGSLVFRGRSALKEVPHLDEELLEAIRAYGAAETERRRAVWPRVVEAVTSVYKRLTFQDYPIDKKVFVSVMSITLMLSMGPDHTVEEYDSEAERLFFEDANLMDALVKNLWGLMAQATVKYRREGFAIEVQVPGGTGWKRAASYASQEYPLGKCTHYPDAYKLVITPMGLREWLEANLSDKEIKLINEYYGYVDEKNRTTRDLLAFYGREEVGKKVHALLGRVCHVKENSLLHYYQTYEGNPNHISTAVAESEMVWDYCKVATEMRIAELKDRLAILREEKAQDPREVEAMTEEQKQKEIAETEAELAKINPETKLDPKAAIEDMDVPEEVRTYIESHPDGKAKTYRPIPILVRRDIPRGWWNDAARALMIFVFKADEKRFKLVK